MTDVLSSIHPIVRARFTDLAARVARYDLAPFAGHRSPADQEKAKAKGASKVGAWHSVHQYGFAVDFAGFRNGEWSWSDHFDWKQLEHHAPFCGLKVPIKWDPGHVIYPLWKTDLATWLKKQTFT